MKKVFLIILLLCISLSVYAAGNVEETIDSVSDSVQDLGPVAAAGNAVMVATGHFADRVTNEFKSAFTIGFLNLHGKLLPTLITSLLVLEIIVLGIMMIVQKENKMSIQEVAWRTLFVFITIQMINMLPWLTSAIGNVFSQAGFVAGQGTTASRGLQPSMVTSFYAIVMKSVEDYLEAYDILTSTFLRSLDYGLTDIGVWFPAWAEITFGTLLTHAVAAILKFIVMILFVFVLISVVLCICELYLLMVVSAFMLPWKLFKFTSFLAEGVFKALFGQGIKLFVMTFVLSSSSVIFSSTFDYINTIDYKELTTTLLGMDVVSLDSIEIALGSIWNLIPTTLFVTIVFCYFMLHGPNIAKALIIGQPTMDNAATSGVKAIGSIGMSISMRNRLGRIGRGSFGNFGGGSSSTGNSSVSSNTTQ